MPRLWLTLGAPRLSFSMPPPTTTPVPHAPPDTNRRRDACVMAAAILAAMLFARLVAAVIVLSAWRGGGYDDSYPLWMGLFRFDASAYLSIAQDGYAYQGDAYSTPNIVFFPLYPLLVRLVAMLPGVGPVAAGFAINGLALAGGIWLCHTVMRRYFGEGAAWFTVAGLLLAPGAFALHAWYSESVTLFFIGLSFHLLQRQRYLAQALAAGALSAARVPVVAICGLFALHYLWLAWLAWRPRQGSAPNGRRALFLLCCAVLTCSGFMLYMLYLWINWGNPFKLLPTIQSSSWGNFHKPVSIVSLLTLQPFFRYLPGLFQRDAFVLLDIRTINYLSLLLMCAACAYTAIRHYRQWVFSFGFLGYALVIYMTNTGSDYLISTHRFALLALPVYLMLYDGWHWLRRRAGGKLANAVLLAGALLSLIVMTICLAAFAAGEWYFF